MYCVNDIGTGHHCGCPTNQKLSDDGIRCEGQFAMSFHTTVEPLSKDTPDNYDDTSQSLDAAFFPVLSCMQFTNP